MLVVMINVRLWDWLEWERALVLCLSDDIVTVATSPTKNCAIALG